MGNYFWRAWLFRNNQPFITLIIIYQPFGKGGTRLQIQNGKQIWKDQWCLQSIKTQNSKWPQSKIWQAPWSVSSNNKSSSSRIVVPNRSFSAKCRPSHVIFDWISNQLICVPVISCITVSTLCTKVQAIGPFHSLIYINLCISRLCMKMPLLHAFLCTMPYTL